MQAPHELSRVSVSFDEPNLVSHAGLVPVAELAQRLRVGERIDETLTLAGLVGPNSGAKALTLIGSVLAGGDCIDDVDVLRAGAAAGQLRQRLRGVGRIPSSQGCGTTAAAGSGVGRSGAPAELVRAVGPTLFSESARAEVVDEFTSTMVEFHPAGLRAMARSFADADLRDVLPRVDVPTLLLYGDKDLRVPLDVPEALHAAIATSRLVVLPGVGHVSCVEAPERFNREIREFLHETEVAEPSRQVGLGGAAATPPVRRPESHSAIEWPPPRTTRDTDGPGRV